MYIKAGQHRRLGDAVTPNCSLYPLLL